MLDPPVTRYMSMNPRVVAPESTLAGALQLMRRSHIRHLPVVRDGVMVGLVSDRDLGACRSVPHFDPDLVTVEEIMEKDVLVVSLPPEAASERPSRPANPIPTTTATTATAAAAGSQRRRFAPSASRRRDDGVCLLALFTDLRPG